MKPSNNIKRNDEARQRILALIKKQRSPSTSPILCHDDCTLKKSFIAITDQQHQPDFKENDQGKSTEGPAIESPITQRNLKKRKWIQKRARAVREAMSPQKHADNHSVLEEVSEHDLKRKSDSSTEPDDSYESESDDDSHSDEFLDSNVENTLPSSPSPPILDDSPCPIKERLFTLQDVKFISDENEIDSRDGEMHIQNSKHTEVQYPSDEKSVHLHTPNDTFDIICSSDLDKQLSFHSFHSFHSSFDQNQDCTDVHDQEIGHLDNVVIGGDTITFDKSANLWDMKQGFTTCEDAPDQQPAIHIWDESGVVFHTFHDNVKASPIQNRMDVVDAHHKPPEEFSSFCENIPANSKDNSATISILSSEEIRLSSMLQKLSKKATDDQATRSNWWDDESKLASLVSPRSASICKTKTKRRDTFDKVFESVSSFFEDLKLDCSVHLCSDIDDRIGHEIDVNDGLQSMVEDDITLDFNSTLMNTGSSTATGHTSKNKTR
jgi:hypothetical protein